MAETLESRALAHAGEEALGFAAGPRPPALESPMARSSWPRRFSEPQGALASPMYGQGSPLPRRPDASFYSTSSPQRSSSPARPASCGPLLARIPLAAISVIAADGKLHQAPAPDASGTVAVGRAAIECSRERPDAEDGPSLAYSKKPRHTAFTSKSVSDWQERKQRDAALLKGILSPSSAWKGAPGSAVGPGPHSAGGSRGLSRHRTVDSDAVSEYSRDRYGGGGGGGYDDVPPVSAGAGDRVFFRASFRSGGGPGGGGVSGAASVASAGRSSVGSASPRRFGGFAPTGATNRPGPQRAVSGRFASAGGSGYRDGDGGGDALDAFDGFSPSNGAAGGSGASFIRQSSGSGFNGDDTWRSGAGPAASGPVPPPPRSTAAGGPGGARSRSLTAEIANGEAAAMRAARQSVYHHDAGAGEGKAESKYRDEPNYVDAAASAREALAGRAAQRRFLVSPMGVPRPESGTGDAMRASAPPSRASATATAIASGGRSGYASQQRYGNSYAAASEYDETAPAPVAARAVPAPILAPSPTRARALGGAGGSFRAPATAGAGPITDNLAAAAGTAIDGGSLLNVVPPDAGYAAAASRRLGAHATRSMSMRLSGHPEGGAVTVTSEIGTIYDDTAAPSTSVVSPARHGGTLAGTAAINAGGSPLMAVATAAMTPPLSSPAKTAGRSQLAASGAAVTRQDSVSGTGSVDSPAGSAAGPIGFGRQYFGRFDGAGPGATGVGGTSASFGASDMDVLLATMGTRPKGYADAHTRSVHLQQAHPGLGGAATTGAAAPSSSAGPGRIGTPPITAFSPPVSPLSAGGQAAMVPLALSRNR